MGFRWKDAVSGGINGAKAGTKVMPGWGTLIGGVAGAAAGGYAKDWDKDLTGNSQSGTVEGALDVAGSTYGGGIKGSSFGSLMNLFQNNSDSKGNLNAGNLGQFQGQDLTHTGSGTFQLGEVKGLDISGLLKMTDVFQGGGGMGGDAVPAGAGIAME